VTQTHDHTAAALAARTQPWEPLYGFTKTDPIRLASALEAVRCRICAYGPLADTCDCKYGLGETLTAGPPAQSGSERTGCPELRSAIRLLLHPEDAARAAAPLGESPAAVLAERDQMVAVIARLMSLPPEKVADAYGVGYTGAAAVDNLHAPLTGIEVRS
jgi:hypothetical protein